MVETWGSILQTAKRKKMRVSRFGKRGPPVERPGGWGAGKEGIREKRDAVNFFTRAEQKKIRRTIRQQKMVQCWKTPRGRNKERGNVKAWERNNTLPHAC